MTKLNKPCCTAIILRDKDARIHAEIRKLLGKKIIFIRKIKKK